MMVKELGSLLPTWETQIKCLKGFGLNQLMLLHMLLEMN